MIKVKGAEGVRISGGKFGRSLYSRGANPLNARARVL